jgi:hypothetical protein
LSGIAGELVEDFLVAAALEEIKKATAMRHIEEIDNRFRMESPSIDI